MTIIPAILVDDAAAFRARLDALPKHIDTVSVDIMDGSFVSPTTFFDAAVVGEIDTLIHYELDLMVNDPLPIVRSWTTFTKTIRAIVHAEIPQDVRAICQEIRALGLEVGIALLPKTTMAQVEHLLNAVDMVLVRGNEPGRAGQPFLKGVLPKIEVLHREYPELMINVDIGVNAKTLPDIVHAGATHVCVNSAIFNAPDPHRALLELEQITHTSS